jgi:hypothetical protein
MDLKQTVHGVTIAKACSIKPYKAADTSKQVTLNVRFEGVALQSVFDKAVAGAVIQWQNGPGRSKFDTWKDHQVVDIEFKAPGRAPQLTAVEQFIIDAKRDGIDTNDKDALKAYITKRLIEAA